MITNCMADTNDAFEVHGDQHIVANYSQKPQFRYRVQHNRMLRPISDRDPFPDCMWDEAGMEDQLQWLMESQKAHKPYNYGYP